jgi:serine/threonine protein kinase
LHFNIIAGYIHRDIKPSNILIKQIEEKVHKIEEKVHKIEEKVNKVEEKEK